MAQVAQGTVLGPLPLVPLLAAEPLAPGLASHLLIETVAPLFESLAQGRLLLAHPLHGIMWTCSVALAAGSGAADAA